MTDIKRKYNLVLFGASGFTGQLIAAYLAEKSAAEQITWAIAGRDKLKLQQLKSSLSGSLPDIITADLNDSKSLENLAGTTTLLLNTVGPYNLYGLPVVKACLEMGTHYMDLSGEPMFVNGIYREYHEAAAKRAIAIVNSCGFDSIPADYAAWLTVRKLPASAPKALYGFVRTNASFSGGTWASAIHGIHQSGRNKTPHQKTKKHPDSIAIPLNIHYNRDINGWAIPMPVSDPHIVKRSARHAVQEYGEAFSYGQFFVRSSFMKVVKTVAPLALLLVLAKINFFKNLILNRVKPGTGPSKERREISKFEVTCIGKTNDLTVKTVISGGDPGYDETAKIFSEAAFQLLVNAKNNTLRHGVLTPVEAFGLPLVERLKRNGISIT